MSLIELCTYCWFLGGYLDEKRPGETFEFFPKIMKIGRKPIQMLNKNKNFNTSIFN
jgi:hypothetical protein